MAAVDFQVVFSRSSNLPEDRIVHTLYYDTGALILDNQTAAIADGIAAAYTSRLLDKMSGSITGMRINAYEPGLNPQGPAFTKAYAFNPATAPGPAEVACCLSYYAGQNSGRRRGRVYHGPFAGAELQSPRPLIGLQERIRNWANDIFALGNNSPANWLQHSRTDQSYNAVSNWYVDNSWDTQRRRGESPTSRVLGSG